MVSGDNMSRMNLANATGNNENTVGQGINATHAVQGAVLHGMVPDAGEAASNREITASTGRAHSNGMLWFLDAAHALAVMMDSCREMQQRMLSIADVIGMLLTCQVPVVSRTILLLMRLACMGALLASTFKPNLLCILILPLCQLLQRW